MNTPRVDVMLGMLSGIELSMPSLVDLARVLEDELNEAQREVRALRLQLRDAHALAWVVDCGQGHCESPVKFNLMDYVQVAIAGTGAIASAMAGNVAATIWAFVAMLASATLAHEKRNRRKRWTH